MPKKDSVIWTNEMKNDLIRYWNAGMDIMEISDRLGVQFEKVQAAVTRVKRGVWGAEAQRELLDADVAAPETAAAPVSTPVTSDGSVDMIGAIDVLTSCAAIFGSTRILEAGGSTLTGQSRITFERADGGRYTIALTDVLE